MKTSMTTYLSNDMAELWKTFYSIQLGLLILLNKREGKSSFISQVVVGRSYQTSTRPPGSVTVLGFMMPAGWLSPAHSLATSEKHSGQRSIIENQKDFITLWLYFSFNGVTQQPSFDFCCVSDNVTKGGRIKSLPLVCSAAFSATHFLFTHCVTF